MGSLLIYANDTRFATLAGAFNLGGESSISCNDVSKAQSIFDWGPYRLRHCDAYDEDMAYLNGLITSCQTHDAGIAFGVIMW